MTELASKHYKKSRLKNLFRFSLKKILHMGILIAIGEYMLLKVISISLSGQITDFAYENVTRQLISLAVSEKPILKVAQAYSHIKKNIDFDSIIQTQYPIQIKGTRPDFRTLDLQDKEGAKVGYVVKF
jgi:hypothetical protein